MASRQKEGRLTVLKTFFDFYLPRIEPGLAESLLALLPHSFEKSSLGLAEIFCGGSTEHIEFLLRFHEEMMKIRRSHPNECIMFDDPDNVCYPFFVKYAVESVQSPVRKLIAERFGSEDTDLIAWQLAGNIEHRNWFRINVASTMQEEDYFRLSEVIALINFTSGGEYSFINLVLPEVREWQGRILDAGCGMGFSSLAMSRHLEVAAVDASVTRLNRARSLYAAIDAPGMIGRLTGILEAEMGEMQREKGRTSIEEILKGERRNVEFIKASLNDLPLAEKAMEGIVCLDVLEHTYDPGSVVREFARILRPGGRLWITVPNSNGEHYQRYEESRRGAAFPAMLHLHHWREADLKSLFDSHGFNPLRIQPFDRLEAGKLADINLEYGQDSWSRSLDGEVYLQLFAVLERSS